MKIKGLIGWIIVYVLLLAVVVLWGSQSIQYCWDGIEIDEALLMEYCGITEEDYLSPDYNPEDCPEAEDAFVMVGGCETDWSSVLMVSVIFSAAFFIVSGAYFLVRGCCADRRLAVDFCQHERLVGMFCQQAPLHAPWAGPGDLHWQNLAL